MNSGLNMYEKMSSRERVFKALNHEEPDRVPYNARLDRELAEALQKVPGDGVDYRMYFNEDIIFTDINFEYSKLSLDYFPLPDKGEILQAAKRIKEIKDEGKVAVNSYIAGVYEHIKALMGGEAALVAMYESPEGLLRNIEKIAEWLCKLNGIFAMAGVDICWIGDDIGAQKSLIMSPNDYKRFYRPYHKEIVNSIRKINPDIKVAFHCCGHVAPLIPELIDIGVDILETVQPEADNDLRYIKNEYGKYISFWGAIGNQSVFSCKTTDEVRDGICESLRIMSKGGGYIASPCHTLTNEVKIENVMTFYYTVSKYGFYPEPGVLY